MEMSAREFWTMVHGMGFGALYLLVFSVAMVELWRRYAPGEMTPVKESDEQFLRAWLIGMAILAWVTVLSGTYIIYPWYRAVPPQGATNLSSFPQRLLMSHPETSAWHAIGMEWKEHIAWIVPIAMTMAALVFSIYRRNLRNKPELRAAMLCFLGTSFVAALLAGFWGAMLNKHAPVGGGTEIHLVTGESR
jgi:hypothetical protein